MKNYLLMGLADARRFATYLLHQVEIKRILRTPSPEYSL